MSLGSVSPCVSWFLGLFYLLFFILVAPAQAREDLIPGSLYTSGRGAAMGDAALPGGDDAASGLFYNPAILAKIRKTEIEPINVTAYVNSPYVTGIDSNFYNATSLSSFNPTLQKHPGQMAGVGGAFFPNFAVPGFAFGVLMQSQMAGQANSNGTVTYRSVYQLIPTLGTGMRFAGGVVRIGYSAQWINEAVGNPTVSSSANPLGYDQGLSQGSTISHNFGIALTAPIEMLPSFNVVVRNIISSSFFSYSLLSLPNSTGTPQALPMTVDASFSIQPKIGRGVSLNLVVEGRDMTNQSGDAFLGHIAAGAEFVIGNRVFVRGGWGGGYPSLGLGLKNKNAELSLAWFTEEIGTGYLSQGDSRFMLQYQLRIF